MIKAVIFDLDDTLISENEYIKSGFKLVSQYLEQQYSEKKETIFKELIDLYKKNSKNIFNRWLDNHDIKYTDEEIIKIVGIYRQHNPDIKFYQDVIPIIKKLKRENIKVGIITDGYKETQLAKLKAVSAYNIFDEIIITDKLGKKFWKPHPKAFEIMKQKLNADFEEMIYVGDNPEKDFYIGKICPINCCRIIREDGIYKNSNYLNDFTEKIRINNLEELYEYINSCNTAK